MSLTLSVLESAFRAAWRRDTTCLDAGRSVDVAGHELLLDPLTCHIVNQTPEKVIADCAAKQRLGAHVQSIDWDYESTGEQDYMREILELLALPCRDHPDYQVYWSC